MDGTIATNTTDSIQKYMILGHNDIYVQNGTTYITIFIYLYLFHQIIHYGLSTPQHYTTETYQDLIIYSEFFFNQLVIKT
jgi:hypothetical protein